MSMECVDAFYIKLGKSGKYATDSIANGLLRFGWEGIPLSEIRSGSWADVHRRLAREHKSKGTVTADTNRLIDLASATSRDIFITFYQSCLWWARVSDDLIEEDAISKYRRLAHGWTKIDQSGQVLLSNRIPGRIAKLQGFRGTLCRVQEKDVLKRLLSGTPSLPFLELRRRQQDLAVVVVAAIQSLHWKDFETLVDLVFRAGGWKRTSVLGETMKFADLELEEPITGDRYQVQVKSQADAKDFRYYRSHFASAEFRRLYFVVHSPSKSLRRENSSSQVELVLPERLGELVVRHGLVDWVAERIR